MLLFVSYTDFYVTIKCRFSKDNSTSNESAKGALGPRLGKLKRAEVGFKSARAVQGHPTTVFCKISVRRSKYCLEFSIT